MFLNKHTYKFLKDLLRVIKPEMEFLNTESEESVKKLVYKWSLSIPAAQKQTSSPARKTHEDLARFDDDTHESFK